MTQITIDIVGILQGFLSLLSSSDWINNAIDGALSLIIILFLLYGAKKITSGRSF
jgi:hypothetical protein